MDPRLSSSPFRDEKKRSSGESAVTETTLSTTMDHRTRDQIDSETLAYIENKHSLIPYHSSCSPEETEKKVSYFLRENYNVPLFEIVVKRSTTVVFYFPVQSIPLVTEEEIKDPVSVMRRFILQVYAPSPTSSSSKVPRTTTKKISTTPVVRKPTEGPKKTLDYWYEGQVLRHFRPKIKKLYGSASVSTPHPSTRPIKVRLDSTTTVFTVPKEKKPTSISIKLVSFPCDSYQVRNALENCLIKHEWEATPKGMKKKMCPKFVPFIFTVKNILASRSRSSAKSSGGSKDEKEESLKDWLHVFFITNIYAHPLFEPLLPKTRRSSDPLTEVKADTLLVSHPVILQKHQKDILRFFCANKALLLFHEAGTGKTLCAISCAVQYILQGLRDRKERKVLIMAPASTVEQVWKKSLDRYLSLHWDRMVREYKKLYRHSKDDGPESPAPVRKLSSLIRDPHFQDKIVSQYNILRYLRKPSTFTIVTEDTFKKIVVDPVLKSGFMEGSSERSTLLIVDEAHNYKSKLITYDLKKNRTKSRRSQRVGSGSGSGSEKTKKEKYRVFHTSFFLRQACAEFVDKALFLTATPIVNKTMDLKNILQNIRILNSPHPFREFGYREPISLKPVKLTQSQIEEGPPTFDNPEVFLPTDGMILNAKNEDEVVTMFEKYKAMVSYVQRPEAAAGTTPNFPRAIFKKHLLKVDVTVSAYGKKYMQGIEKKMTGAPSQTVGGDKKDDKKNKKKAFQGFVAIKNMAGTKIPLKFYIHERLGGIFIEDHSTEEEEGKSDIILSPKFQFIMGELEDDKGERLPDLESTKTVIYVHRGKSVELLKKEISAKKPEMVSKIWTVTGKDKMEERRLICDQFNASPTGLMIISNAGSEGLDMKGVRHVVLLDEVWTPSAFDQIVGRGVRFRSHFHLPESERDVTIHEIGMYPKNIPGGKAEFIFADEKLRGARYEKQKLIDRITKALLRLSFPPSPSSFPLSAVPFPTVR